MDKKKWKDMTTLERFFYLKMCWGTAYSHLSVLMGIIGFAIGWGTFIKVWGFTQPWHYVVSIEAGLFGVFLLIYFGHWTQKRKWRDLETSMNNAYNPELMRLLNKPVNITYRERRK